jgi:hypothetical protein
MGLPPYAEVGETPLCKCSPFRTQPTLFILQSRSRTDFTVDVSLPVIHSPTNRWAAQEGTLRRTRYQLGLRPEATREVHMKRRTNFVNKEGTNRRRKGVKMQPCTATSCATPFPYLLLLLPLLVLSSVRSESTSPESLIRLAVRRFSN